MKDEINDRLAALAPDEDELANDRTLKKQERFKLVEAMRAILDGRPTDERLQAVLKKQGRVPLTKHTVSIESGVDRRRFSGGDRHREISDLLKELKPDYGGGKTLTERLERQARAIVLLEQQLVAARSATAAQVARIDALKMKLKSANDRIKRLEEGSPVDGED